MVGGLDADGWADAVEPGFEIGLNLDEVFALGWVLGEHQTELCALFDDLVLAQVRRRWLAGVLIDQTDVSGPAGRGKPLGNTALARVMRNLAYGFPQRQHESFVVVAFEMDHFTSGSSRSKLKKASMLQSLIWSICS